MVMSTKNKSLLSHVINVIVIRIEIAKRNGNAKLNATSIYEQMDNIIMQSTKTRVDNLLHKTMR